MPTPRRDPGLPTRSAVVALLLGLSLVCAACASRGGRPGPASAGFDREQETKAVYVAVLNDLYGRDWVNREVEQWVVDPELRAVEGGRDELVRSLAGDARPDTIADLERGRPAGRVPPDLAPGRPVRWFTDADFAALPKDPGGSGSGWPAFHERFPRSPGHVTLTHVGFSADGTEALLQPGCWFDSLGGARSLVLLRKDRGTWRVVGHRHTAVS